MNKKIQTSKLIVYIVLFTCLFDLQLIYVLAYWGRTAIAETLSCTVVTTLLGTLIGYFAKAFFETREEENLKYYREIDKYNMEQSNQEWENTEE